jgi:hypothetical protein
MDEITCSECGAEADPHTKRHLLPDDGWDLDGEFGERCPECVAEANRVNEGTAGLNDLAEALGAKKKEQS